MQARPAVLLLRSHHSSSRKQDGSAGSQIEIAAFLLPLPFFLPIVILIGGKRKIAKSMYNIRARTGVRNVKPQLPSGGFPAVFGFQLPKLRRAEIGSRILRTVMKHPGDAKYRLMIVAAL